MFSNRQVFENVIIPIHSTYEARRYGHLIKESFTRISPGTPLLVVLPFFVFVYFLGFTSINQRKFYHSRNLRNLNHYRDYSEFFSTILPEDKKSFTD